MQLPPDVVAKMPYDPSREWQAGMTPDQFLKLGDIEEAFHPELLTVRATTEMSGLNPEQIALSNLDLAQWQTIDYIRAAIPILDALPLGEVQPILDVVKTVDRAVSLGTRIADLLQDKPELGKLALGQIDLSKYSLESIPGLADTPLAQFGKWQQAAIKGIPGLSQIPFDKFPVNPFNMNGGMAQIDIVWGPQEKGANYKVITGSKEQGFKVPCGANQNCAYIELNDLPAGTNPTLQGARWIKGGKPEVGGQWVKGGHGMLAKAPIPGVPPGKEPTGRLPWGDVFKLVLIDTDEATATAKFGLYFRACSDVGGCTPYSIGPVPFLTLHEQDPLFVGFFDGRKPPAPPTVDVPKHIQDQIDKYSEEEGESEDGPLGDDCTKNILQKVPQGELRAASKFVPLLLEAARRNKMTDPAQVAYLLATTSWETNMGSAMLERGVGCGTYGPGCFQGRGFIQLTGEYNYQKLGGMVGVDLVSRPELAADPKRAADIAVKYLQWRGIGNYLNKGKQNFYDARDIVNGDKHYISERAPEGVGRRIAKWATGYHQALKACALAGTGKWHDPMPGGVQTHAFGKYPHGSPPHTHMGIDISKQGRVPIYSARDGVVIYRNNNCSDYLDSDGWYSSGDRSCGGGYGNTVELRHDNGYITLYAHNSKVLVQQNQRVRGGQVIAYQGSTGSSSGEHLHFEVIRGGQKVSPRGVGIPNMRS